MRRTRGCLAGLGFRLDLAEVEAKSAEEQDGRAGDAEGDHALQLLLVLVVVERRQVSLVLLLLAHRLHAGALLGFDASLLNLAVADGIEARSFFLRPLLFAAAAVFFGLEACGLLVTRATLCLDPGLHIGLRSTLLLVVLGLDAILFEVHQLFEGKED